MSRYEYPEGTHTGGWILQVRDGTRYVGNVRKNRVTGRYQFFRGSKNAIRPMLEEPDLETLKRRIEEIDL
jgi:hypothetical protein